MFRISDDTDTAYNYGLLHNICMLLQELAVLFLWCVRITHFKLLKVASVKVVVSGSPTQLISFRNLFASSLYNRVHQKSFATGERNKNNFILL